MGFWGCKVCNFTKFPLNSWPWKCLVLVTIVMVYKAMLLSKISWSNVNGKDGVIGLEEEWDYGVRRDKFVEVPQIVWGLNNQKIAFARACLTARMLNRTLLMPSLSASLFYKEIDQLEPISFDKVFQLEKFNSMCNGFVRVGRYSEVLNASEVVELTKGSGRKWTDERDIGQLREFGNDPYDEYEVIRILGKNPFLWNDHWPVKEYAKVFECLVLVDELAKEADRVISRIREAVPRKTGSLEPAPYMAVHMRIEKDWMIHCKKREQRSKINEICSSKEEITQRVGNIKGLNKPLAVYLAVADSLLEDETILSGWDDGLLPFEKKRLGVKDIYDKYPYLIKSAIDYEVCLRANVFVGNSFSTFSNLIVLERTQKMIHSGLSSTCSSGLSWPSYAYNIKGDFDGPKRWMTNMSDISLQTISYGTNQVSC
ncbi:O-fucosyltransferase 23 [Silene latifolia]|uniref:O-fucosyltransferase 23 n=1 Tax=Silene latifolia TaxID=37657 RepID=UPI003D786C77